MKKLPFEIIANIINEEMDQDCWAEKAMKIRVVHRFQEYFDSLIEISNEEYRSNISDKRAIELDKEMYWLKGYDKKQFRKDCGFDEK